MFHKKYQAFRVGSVRCPLRETAKAPTWFFYNVNTFSKRFGHPSDGLHRPLF